MESRDFDFVIFGASGFTGKYVVQEVFKHCKTDGITMAVAGRNRDKLTKVISTAVGENEDEIQVEVIIADVKDFQSLVLMCSRARVVLNCVGPYRFFGEPVVKACVEAKTNYVDISGEPQFLENMQLKYDEAAKEAGVIIVGACGFDSIPSDLGAVFTQQQFQGTLNSIKAYLSVNAGPSGYGFHFTTYESAVHGISDVKSLSKIRKQFGHKPLPTVGPRMKREGFMHYLSFAQSYCIPFLGADASVVKRSQRYFCEELDEPPTQYSMYSCIGSMWNIFLMMVFGGIFKFLAMRSWGRSLLLNHPKFFTLGLFSHEGPTKQQLKESSFNIVMFGEGYPTGSFDSNKKPKKKITVKVSGPEPGYVATPIAIVQSALCIIQEKQNLPKRGGVFAPAAAFGKTSLIPRLHERGIKFDVLNHS
nr:saccharopine dehydrogenase-like oxidoreductase [Ciona intestinalis]|eukprot:XP_002125674.1 saccharopine dehydrogenase-like oxidoreductase [Ciona intestinalis]